MRQYTALQRLPHQQDARGPLVGSISGYLVDARSEETGVPYVRRVFDDYTPATRLAERLEKRAFAEGHGVVVRVYRLTCAETLLVEKRTVGVPLPGVRSRHAPLPARILAEVAARGLDLSRQLPNGMCAEIAGCVRARPGAVKTALWRLRRRRGIHVRRAAETGGK